MEQALKELYAETFESLSSCPADDKEQALFFCGQQRALEQLADKCGIKLEHKNIFTLADQAGIRIN